MDDPDADFEPEGLVFEVGGQSWPYAEKALILLHKPSGFECSQSPSTTPACCPAAGPTARTRRAAHRAAGRDTTGLLLLTDDGSLIHKLTSPKHHVPKGL